MSENSQEKDQDPDSITGLLNHFVEVSKGKEAVTVGELMDSLDSRSHGPMLLFPAIIAVSPVGMIPGMSIVTGSLVLLIAIQMMFFSSRPWIPKRLAEFEIPQDKLENGVEKTNRWVRKFEKVVKHRLEFLASGLAIYPIAILSILLALTFYPLALVPFGVFAPGMAVVMFGLGLTAKDGVVVSLGFALTLGSLYLIWTQWPF